MPASRAATAINRLFSRPSPLTSHLSPLTSHLSPVSALPDFARRSKLRKLRRASLGLTAQAIILSALRASLHCSIAKLTNPTHTQGFNPGCFRSTRRALVRT